MSFLNSILGDLKAFIRNVSIRLTPLPLCQPMSVNVSICLTPILPLSTIVSIFQHPPPPPPPRDFESLAPLRGIPLPLLEAPLRSIASSVCLCTRKTNGRSQYCRTGIHANHNERKGCEDPPRSLYTWQHRHLAILGPHGGAIRRVCVQRP